MCHGEFVEGIDRWPVLMGGFDTLTDQEVYAVSLYILYLYDLVELDDVHDQDGFAKIKMPNKDGFLIPDPRPDTPMDEPCMQDCAAADKIIGKARILDVTPDQEGGDRWWTSQGKGRCKQKSSEVSAVVAPLA